MNRTHGNSGNNDNNSSSKSSNNSPTTVNTGFNKNRGIIALTILISEVMVVLGVTIPPHP